MEQTFHQQVQSILRTYGITKPEHIGDIKRWYRDGAKKVRAKLIREVNTESIYVDIDQEDSGIFQLPVYAGRAVGVKYNLPGSEYPLEEVRSRSQWQEMTSYGGQRGTPTHWRVLGDNEFEVWPRPVDAVENGLEVAYIPRQSALTADDITTGTCAMSGGSDEVVFSQGIASSDMVGRWFKTTDGSHEYWYRIIEYISNNRLRLENFYDGPGGSGRTFCIGDIVDIPEHALDLPELYARAEYIGLYRKDRRARNDMMREFTERTKELRREYSVPGKSQVIKGTRHKTYHRMPLFYDQELKP